LEGGSAGSRAALHERAKKLVRTVMLLAYGVAALASIALALSWLGIGGLQTDPRLIGRWLITHGVNALLIVVGATFVMRAANLAIERLQHRLGAGRSQTDLEWQRRASTLRGILTNLVTAAVGFVALLMLLRELSIDVLPILTTAGVAGLAIGFGAQNLVRDVISGFFVILEDQVRIGDLARINAVTGIIEEINLRTIVLRDADAAVHVFPNGTITALANLSKGYSYAVVDVRLGYTENLDRVFGSIREVGASMEQDSKWVDRGPRGRIDRRWVCDCPDEVQDAPAQSDQDRQRAAPACDDDVRGPRDPAVRRIATRSGSRRIATL
jgi:small-conductance mechanosensitive channel